MKETGAKIVEVARRYNGEREVPPNKGFQNPLFERKMRAVGKWKPPFAWCACFVRLVWMEAFKELNLPTDTIDSVMVPGVLNTYNGFIRSKKFVVSKKPVVGALAVWRSGKTAFGHIGIVTQVNSDRFQCCEGNTNSEGGREGLMVAVRPRRLDFTPRARGLYLLGFVHPPKIQDEPVAVVPEEKDGPDETLDAPEKAAPIAKAAVDLVQLGKSVGLVGGGAVGTGVAAEASGYHVFTDYRAWIGVSVILALVVVFLLYRAYQKQES